MSIEVKNFDQYQGLALRTVKPEDTELQSLLHCVMGMAGELGEFIELPYSAQDQRTGELGDCMWYSAVLASLLGNNFGEVMSAAEAQLDDAVGDMAYRHGQEIAWIFASRMIDRVKKSVFYGKELDLSGLRGELIAYCAGLVGMGRKQNVNLLYAGLINIKKLAERYKDGRFDAGHAINRDYAAESDAAGCTVA